MARTISLSRRPPAARHEPKPGRSRTSRLVRFYPSELKQVATAAGRKGVSLSRYIAEAAIARARPR